jgi:hypothetical protein
MLKVDKLQLDLIINGDETRKALQELEIQARSLVKEIKTIKDATLKGTKIEELNQVQKKMEDLRNEIGLNGMTMKELRDRASLLKMVLDKLVPDTDVYKKYDVELQQVSGRINELRGKAKESQSLFGKDGISGMILGAAGGISLAGVFSGVMGKAKEMIVDMATVTRGSAGQIERAVTGMKFGYEAFLRSINTGDWSNLFSNMAKAIELGNEFAATEQKIAKMREAEVVLQAKNQQVFDELWGRFNNEKGLYTEQERIKYGQAALELRKKDMEAMVHIADLEKDNQEKKIMEQTKLSKYSIERYVLEYRNNEQLIDQARRVSAIRKEMLTPSLAASLANDATIDDARNKALKEELDRIPQVAKSYSILISSMMKSDKESMEIFVKAWGAKYKAYDDFFKETRRLDMQVGQAKKSETAKEDADREAAAKKREDQAKAYAQKRETAENEMRRLMETTHEMERSNFAEKLSATEMEIKAVNDKYNAEIRKLKEFAVEKDKILKPSEKKEISDSIGQLEILRDQQVKQVLVQAEQKFADDVRQIHEQLRVARMAVTTRQVYEVNKKYDDAEKEILEAIESRYRQEVELAGTDAGKVLAAEKNKADNLVRINKDLQTLEVARKEETQKAIHEGDMKFEEELDKLKLKSEAQLATGKEKIQLELNLKYRKLLEDNVNDTRKTEQIKAQMKEEFRHREEELTRESNRKMAQDFVNYAKEASRGLNTVFQAMDASENAQLKKDENLNNEKKANLKKRLDAGLITQKQYDAAIIKGDQEVEKKRAQLAHEQAVRQKEMAVFNATIAFLQAIIQAANIAPPADIVMPIIVAGLMGLELAALIATPVPQASKGIYNVTGADDGKLYSNVPLTRSLKTGYYTRPTLVAEEPEYIIDTKTTREISMNYPEIFDAINNVREVSQRYRGRYPDNLSGTGTVLGSSGGKDNQLDAINRLNDHLDRGITAVISYDAMMLENAKIDQIKKDVTK